MSVISTPTLEMKAFLRKARVRIKYLLSPSSTYIISVERKIPDAEFRQVIPDVDEYTKEPPALPPHLRHIILNKVSCIPNQIVPSLFPLMEIKTFTKMQ